MKLNVVPASEGATWVRLGVRTFWRQPFALGGLFLMFIIFTSLFAFIPRVGNLLAIVFIPAFSLGLMAASRHAHQGQFPMPKLLLTAFRNGVERRNAMFRLGLAYLFFFAGVLGGSALIDDGQFASLYLFGGQITPELVQTPAFESAVWMATLCYIPVSAMFWHAPALVHWHGVPVAKSLFFSLMACLSNWKAFLVYLLCWVLLILLVIFSLITVLSLLDLGEASGVTLTPALMLLAAMFFTSSYFSYVSCFEQQLDVQA